jgi:glutathione synthase/RimK-type ligase-like ATP-grasp enzyme
MNFSFISYSELPELDPDDQLAVTEARRRGHECNAVVWNDPEIDWHNAGICVLRNTWDYHLNPDAFLRWAGQVASTTTLVNPLQLVQWNLDKKYLLDLESRGINIVPTVALEKQSTPSLHQLLEEHNWERAIVKPSIGLATSGVKKVDTTNGGIEAGQEHLEKLLVNGDALLQPYMESIETYGERSLVFIAGQYSHTVRKTPFQIMAVAGQAGETLAASVDQEIQFAKEAIEKLDQTPLYARVDIIPDNENGYRLMELELIEPSLFFSLYAPAVVPFVDALEALR